MKPKLFFTVLFFYSVIFNAQKITLNELEILTDRNFEEFSNFSINKSYKLLTSKDNYLEFYLEKPNWGTFVIKKDNSATYPVIMYMVSNKNDYQEIQKQLKEKKYNFMLNDNSSGEPDPMASFAYKREDQKFLAVVQITNEYYKIYIYSTDL